MMIRSSLLILSLVFATQVTAQMRVQDDSTAESLVRDILLGDGVELVSVTFVGKRGSLGGFQTDSTLFGMAKGIILTTGTVKGVLGPNDKPSNTSLGILPVSGVKRRIIRNGDKDLNAISPAPTLDNAILQIEFVPTYGELEFSYIFASEEYLEYCGSQYNDIFGFFLSGPSIAKQNLAVLPDGKTTVSVNTINNKVNPEFYRRNDYIKTKGKKQKQIDKILAKKYEVIDKRLNQSLQFDGLTTTLVAKAKVVPGQKYRIKLAIADGSDGTFDSAVFIEGGSFSSVPSPEEAQIELPPIEVDQAKKVHEVSRRVKFQPVEIRYDSDKDEWPDSVITEIDSVLQILKSCENCHIIIDGHTDDKGTHIYNIDLAKRRAKSIYQYFLDEGVSEERLEYYSYGPERPLAPNDTEEGRAMNRRVEIRLEERK